jgi:hypothetical protein
MSGEFSGGSAGLPAPLDAARPRALPTTRQFSTKRWLLAALVAVVAPKCLLCLAGYLAAGGAAVELCGAVETTSHAGAILAVAAGGVLVGALVFGICRAGSLIPPFSREPGHVRGGIGNPALQSKETAASPLLRATFVDSARP